MKWHFLDMIRDAWKTLRSKKKKGIPSISRVRAVSHEQRRRMHWLSTQNEKRRQVRI